LQFEWQFDSYRNSHALAQLSLPRSHIGGFVTTMGGSDKRKQSLYFPEEMLKEIQDEATRQDRSLSWIVQKAWKISRKEIMKYPSVNEFPGEEDERGATE
jgi:uncharacterized small protein (TIGR04563 family)